MAAVLLVRLQTCTAFAPAAARAASRAHVTTPLLQRRHGHFAMRRWHTRSFHVSAVAEVQEDAAVCGPPSILDVQARALTNAFESAPHFSLSSATPVSGIPHSGSYAMQC
eukprot:18825-Heterococcus_DN1.PRE.2